MDWEDFQLSELKKLEEQSQKDYMIGSTRNERVNARRGRNAELLAAAQEACERMGGQASINEHFAIVDTRIFEVKSR